MSEQSDSFSINIYEEELDDETAMDLSSKELESVPALNNLSIVVLYLQNNKLTILPDDFFPTLTNLMYLDLRENRLRELPQTIKNHQALTHLLLQNNCLTALPIELGTVSLKVLQLNGNPLKYPPEDVVSAGKAKILTFLYDKYKETLPVANVNAANDIDDQQLSSLISFNSVNDAHPEGSNLEVKICEKFDDPDDKYYAKLLGKCPKLDKSRHKVLPICTQSEKYLKPLRAEGKKSRDERIKRNHFKDMALKKKTDLLASREKILQERKNIESLKRWRHNYRSHQFFSDPSYRLDPKEYPYDTSPEFMTLLNREDIEKDLPDKYRKTLARRTKTSVPRKVKNDVHLAMKIKKLFENLEALDLNRDTMTPRTEQKVLMNEIQKISEIKQKLMELSTSNMTSVSVI